MKIGSKIHLAWIIGGNSGRYFYPPFWIIGLRITRGGGFDWGKTAPLDGAVQTLLLYEAT